MAEPEAVARFSAIYDLYHDQVYAYAVSRAGRQLAEDVVSGTFQVAWRRLPEVPAAPLPWLLAVARNLVRERYRDQVRQDCLAAELRVWADEATADVAEGVTERVAVLAALARLREGDRELLTLVAWQGLPTREAARVVGCSPATFLVRLHRARRRLEQAMRDVGEAGHRAALTTALTEEYR